MAKTLDELLEWIGNELDEVTLLEVLEITSSDLAQRFSDVIAENLDKFNGWEEEDDEH